MVCAAAESPLMMPSMPAGMDSSTFGASAVKGWLMGSAASSWVAPTTWSGAEGML